MRAERQRSKNGGRENEAARHEILPVWCFVERNIVLLL
jgi:hypothetical protein